MRDDASDFDRAHRLLSTCRKKGLLALSYYYADDPASARHYAAAFLDEAQVYLFGDWRYRFNHPEGKQNPEFWKKRFDWMSVYELCVLWGSVIGDWSTLARIGRFPECDSYVGFSHKPHDRDLFLAIGAFCGGSPVSDVLKAVRRAALHRATKCRLAASALGAIATRDDLSFRKALKQLLAHHETKEFLKVDMLCRISILGTFLYHAAANAGIEVNSAVPCMDYIVRT
jgi:hypothetical protein